MRPPSTTSSTSTTVVRGEHTQMANGYGTGVAKTPSGPPTNGAPPSSGPKHGYAHFDDIKQVKLDVDSVTPVETVLGYAEGCLKQAGFMKEFGRLDAALREYLKASIVLLEVLPSNTAWMSVMTDRKGARVRYNALMAQVSADSEAYEQIKAAIQEDNARTGVKPTNARDEHAQQPNGLVASATVTNGHRATRSSNNFLDIDTRNGFSAPQKSTPPPPSTNSSSSNPSLTPAAKSKAKPAVHPKPQSLHGNALKAGPASHPNGGTNGGKTAQDLAERFANLRTSSTAMQPAQPKQDPRIRTQPIKYSSFQETQQSQLPQQQLQQQQQPQQQQQQLQTLNQFQNYQFQSKGFEKPPTASPLPRAGKLSLTSTLPDLPKVPDAIYSPARGSVSSQATQLPSSTPRGMFSRTNSMTSVSGTIKPPSTSQLPPDDYFSLSHTHSRQSSRPSQDSTRAKRPSIPIPDGDTITVQELLKFMQAGSKDIHVLLVDIRSREDYDEGHIMSQSTICVESEILQRENISAGQIADSMVLAPATETRLFDRRNDFGLVVFYDQESRSIRRKTDNMTAAETAVVAMYNALAYYDYQSDGDSNRTPKLLEGGIEAWVSMMGTASLQTSSTAASVGARASRINQRPRQNTFSRPQAKYITKPIQDADEAKRWEESLKNIEKSSFVRTTDDFLRRFPPVSAIQESMTTPIATKDDNEIGFHFASSSLDGHSQLERPSSRATVATETELKAPAQSSPAGAAATAAATAAAAAAAASVYSTLPAPPTRPAPTVPRQSHSGLEEADDEEHYIRTKVAKANVTGGRVRRQKVGLYNPGNWCYGNSSFQALFASGAFGEELTTGEWANHWKVPMKSDEKISHPQLLSKILANSFHWMQYGKFEAMKAKTIMDYCYHIHSRDFDGKLKTDRATIFGSQYQQDAQEFISFLLENLHDETNRLRDRTGEVQQPPLNPRSTALGNGLQYWHEYRKYNDSLVDKFWRGVEVTDRRCRSCGHPSLTYEHFDALHLPIPPNAAGSTATTIADLLAQYCGADLLPEYKCDQCRRIDTTEKCVRLVRLPDLLCISFRRFQGNEYDGFRKNNTAVVFPVDGLDMTPYTVQARTASADQAADGIDPQTDTQFRGPFVYDCYAVIVHSGTLKSGHYRAFIKDEGAADTHQWYHFDDAEVEPVTIGSNDGRDMARRLYRDNNNGASAYMVFYKRRT
ncbi:AMP-binding enzyme [Niveomyces insectorum RCEF 264]|uniref:AMP-binding enzyme n=1 Tax=Niveomyces insectorum RCEF 264 TaxID=1081102 RepID=A0A167TZB5_9HYPO|nr:AMP-binding enzyme [Niveomyces insectorum RCEF 264]